MKQAPAPIDIDAALFTLGELAEVAGIKRGLVDVWSHRGVIAPTRVARVSGRRRGLFSVRAIVRARLVRVLGEHVAMGPAESAGLAKDSGSVEVADMMAGEDWMFAARRNPHLGYSVAVARIENCWRWKLITKGEDTASYFGPAVPFIVLPIWHIFNEVYRACIALHENEPEKSSDG